ncbi:MAG: glycoside hydrolase family 31 protein [Thermoguttaceae bacterium]|jgi:alpha-glucosidase (family GH31 glycosyl hydrolase)|nr:glycoside hydrolase family 31 protein [Thermoguttaceae bacterium]
MMRLVYWLLFASLVLVGEARSEDAKTSPVWLDSAPLADRNLVVVLDGGGSLRVDVLGERLFRVRYSKTGQWTESALNRYGVFANAFPDVAFERLQTDVATTIATKQARLTVNGKDGAITLAGADGAPIIEQAAPTYETGGGYEMRFALAQDERLYGLGDVCRDNIMRRGGSYEIWVLNVTSYIPIPVVLSNRGWGLLMNTTWRNTIDVGKSDPDRLICTAPRSDLDYYLFCGPDYRGLLDAYTSLTGRPALLPVWGYGHTYVANENIDAFNMMNEAVTFRREGIPCDVFGLEPGWMSKHYDFSTEKKWHPERFPIPHWAPKGPHTFFGALKRKGFKLSLWLCCDYDLGVYEEQQLAEKNVADAGDKSGAAAAAVDVEKGFVDERLSKPAEPKQDANAQPAGPQALEPWFEHLKTFVDQGASAFKLDGSAQVIEHPKREWGNGMTDEEMHNLYPVIYAKQMAYGFEDHTSRRAMVYSAGGYAGVQQYVATWAGDTGGGKRPLASMLNLAFSGHSNHSCDMAVTNVEGLHFGFLQTWAQQNNWDYWYQPWYLEERETAAYRQYARLRYKLLPYLYSTAAEAALTGYPVMRAMPMVYPDDPAWDSAMSQYMLGDFLLVSAFSKEVRLPEGGWIDFFTGKRIRGPATVPVETTPERGGALMVKDGAIIPTWPPCEHVERGWSPEVGLLVYPAAHSTFTLHEDDGQSLDYRQGKFARTLLTCETENETVKLTIGPREGSYAGMPSTRDFAVTIHLPRRPETVKLDGETLADIPWDEAASAATVKIPACGNAARVLTIK